MVFAPYIAIGSVAPLLVSKQLGICVSLQSDQEASWLASYMYTYIDCLAIGSVAPLLITSKPCRVVVTVSQ